MLKRAALAAGLGLAALSVPAEAHAQYGNAYGQAPLRNVQCERQQAQDKGAGVVVGALVGALAGGALGNEISDDRSDSRNHYRGYRSSGRGYGRGYRGHSGRDDNDAEVAVGALLGAVIGGVAGSELAGRSSPRCQVAYAPSQGYAPLPQGSIPRTTDGLYGGPEVMGGSSYPQGGYIPPQRYPASGPSYPDYRDQSASRDCRVIHRETRLPDGDVQREPVTACYDERTREWRVQDGYSDDRYGY